MTSSSPDFQTLRLEVADDVARLGLSRPEVHNAFDPLMIEELTQACTWLAGQARVRVVVLSGEGRSFCAGADLEWMQSSVAWSSEKNRSDALALAAMLDALDRLPKPVVARVHGAALGGGVGLVACADVVVACRQASFGTTEVRLGLLPAVIGPYVIRKIGLSHARACFLTGQRFGAEEAMRMGLVHHLADDEASLDRRTDEVAGWLLAGGPSAQAACKELLRFLAEGPPRESQTSRTAGEIASARAGDEGQEGLRAFLEHRPPRWRKESTRGPL